MTRQFGTVVCDFCRDTLILKDGDLAPAVAAGWDLKKEPWGKDICAECIKRRGKKNGPAEAEDVDRYRTENPYEIVGVIKQFRSADGKYGALLDAVCSLPVCGCNIAGNGTLAHPLEIKFCKDHQGRGDQC